MGPKSAGKGVDLERSCGQRPFFGYDLTADSYIEKRPSWLYVEEMPRSQGGGFHSCWRGRCVFIRLCFGQCCGCRLLFVNCNLDPCKPAEYGLGHVLLCNIILDDAQAS